MANGNQNAKPTQAPYVASSGYYSAIPTATFTRVIKVNATTNNPFTLTGSYANNAGFLVMSTGSIVISSSNGTGFTAVDFHEPSQNHQIFPIALSYVSASAQGEMAILYSK